MFIGFGGREGVGVYSVGIGYDTLLYLREMTDELPELDDDDDDGVYSM